MVTEFLITLAACLAPVAALWWAASRHSMERCVGEVRKHLWSTSLMLRTPIGVDATGRERHTLRPRCVRCGAIGQVVSIATGLKTPKNPELRRKYGFADEPRVITSGDGLYIGIL